MSEPTHIEAANVIGRIARAILPKHLGYMVIVVRNTDDGGSDQATATNIHETETLIALFRSIADGLAKRDFTVEESR